MNTELAAKENSVQTCIILTPRQFRRLRLLAFASKTSQSAIVRKALDRYFIKLNKKKGT